MPASLPDQAELPASLLALIVAADGGLSAPAMRRLEARDAFRHLAVSRERFAELVADWCHRIDPDLCDRSWLSAGDIAQAEPLLDGVQLLDDRLQVCRLADAAVEDQGLVAQGARLLLDHARARWHLAREALAQAPDDACLAA